MVEVGLQGLTDTLFREAFPTPQVLITSISSFTSFLIEDFAEAREITEAMFLLGLILKKNENAAAPWSALHAFHFHGQTKHSMFSKRSVTLPLAAFGKQYTLIYLNGSRLF